MKKVGRYVIVSELGRGAMGVVYRASDPTIDRDVALKVLSLSQGQEEGTNSPQEMFMREVRAAGRLAHPSIVTIYDAFDDPVTQSSCIVMELVPGVTLEKILESGKPPTADQTFGLIRQVAEALDYAHRNKVIHRDLKPANILVTDDGRAKITDFGIAKVLAREGVARTIGIMGTPSYMSPEQVRGGDIDARTDVFSLGIMIFTMLTGQKPFTGNTAAVMFKIVYEDPAAPSTVNTKLSPAHDYFVRKCLAKDRNERYATVRDLLNDLEDIHAGRPPRSQSVEVAATPAAAEAAPVTVAEDQTSDELPAVPPAPSAKPQAPRMPPPPTPLRSEPHAPLPTSKIPPDPTVAMPRSEPAKPVPPTPPSMPLGGTTLVMQVPDLSAISGSSAPTHPPQGAKTPAPSQGAPLTGQTVPMRVPDLSALSSSQPPAPPLNPIGAPLGGVTLPMQVPNLSDISAAPPAPLPKPAAPPRPLPTPAAPVAKPTPPPSAPPVQKPIATELPRPVPTPVAPPRPVAPTRIEMPPPVADSEPTIQFGDEAPEAAPSKSKSMPLVLAAVAFLVIVVAGGLAYWKLHKPAVAEPAQEVVQAPPVIPPPVQAPPLEQPPAAVTPAQTPPPAANPAPAPAKKLPTRKPKQPSTAQPQPQPAPQPAPVVTPAPAPQPAAPSAADIAKAEAAKLLSSPRIINVVCNFSLKEINVAFTGGGKTLYEGMEKGKKKKGGFLGLKGSYEGSFNHTLTVPAGVSTVGVKVQSKDGSLDITNTVKMPMIGGFVPTLMVVVDDGQVTLTWKGAAGAL